MGNPFLRYLDRADWTDGIDQARALNLDEFADAVMGAVIDLREAFAEVNPLAVRAREIPTDPVPNTVGL